MNCTGRTAFSPPPSTVTPVWERPLFSDNFQLENAPCISNPWRLRTVKNFLALKEEAIRVLGALEKLKAAKRFAELFRTIGRSAKEEPLLFIIDDFPTSHQ